MQIEKFLELYLKNELNAVNIKCLPNVDGKDTHIKTFTYNEPSYQYGYVGKMHIITKYVEVFVPYSPNFIMDFVEYCMESRIKLIAFHSFDILELPLLTAKVNNIVNNGPVTQSQLDNEFRTALRIKAVLFTFKEAQLLIPTLPRREIHD